MTLRAPLALHTPQRVTLPITQKTGRGVPSHCEVSCLSLTCVLSLKHDSEEADAKH